MLAIIVMPEDADFFTLSIQLMAMAPDVALFLDTPTELNSVRVVKTPMAPPKKY